MQSGRSVRRRRFLSLGAGALAALAGCSGSSDPSGGAETAEPTTETAAATARDTATEETTSETATGTPQQQSATVKLGETVEGEKLSLVVREVRKTTKLGELQKADSGNEFVVVRMAVKNTSETFVDFNSFLQARIKDDTNYVYDATLGATAHPIESGVLAAGEVARGDVVFEVPRDASGLVLQFDFSAFDLFEFERVTVDLTSKAGSIADVKQSLGVDVLSAGKAAEHQGVGVTVHGVRTAAELGQFTKAKKGNEYVVPDIEITNDTGEPLSVSTALQMRVKDGAGLAYTPDLAATSQLDKKYSEGSEIAAGSSRRGELAYQIGEGTAPLYWAFEFLDLDAKKKAFWTLR